MVKPKVRTTSMPPPCPELDAARGRVADLIKNAERRADEMIERLRTRLAEEEGGCDPRT